MEVSSSIHIHQREEWRAWLEQNYQIEQEIWLVMDKQKTGRSHLTLEGAIEEALCFGWVDSLLQNVDDESYAIRFTPRKNDRKWSVVNLHRAQKMIAAGKMTAAGLQKIDPALLSGDLAPHQRPAVIEVPAFIAQALQSHPQAWENFNHLAPSYRRNYLGWIMDAKRDETRLKRLAEAIERLEKNEKLGMK